MYKKQAGFSALHLLLVVIIGLVGFTGWYVWHARQNTNQALQVLANSSKNNAKVEDKTDSVQTYKTYSNEEYGFSFQYADTWSLAVDMQDAGRGKKEGTVSVTSPNKTVVHFDPNLGGKGGDCWDDQANARTERTCTTRAILSVEKLAASSAAKPIYFYHAKDTAASDNGGKSTFFIFISNDKDAPTKTGSSLGAFMGGYDSVQTGTGYVSVSVQGSDDAKNSSDDFFNTPEVKEATPVLQSFRLME